MQVGTSPDVGSRHHYSSAATSDNSYLKARAVRVAREVAGLERMLPLNRSSSVFVRVDEANCFMWRALITGPEDTPYSGGCFIFDIWFPGQYPTVPPQVSCKAAWQYRALCYSSDAVSSFCVIVGVMRP